MVNMHAKYHQIAMEFNSFDFLLIKSFECLKSFSKLCGLSTVAWENRRKRKRNSENAGRVIEKHNESKVKTTTKKSQLENILISLNLCMHVCDSVRNFMNSIHLFYCHHRLCVCFSLFRATTNEQHTFFSLRLRLFSQAMQLKI